MKEIEPTIIKIESHGKIYSAELPWDVSLDEIINAFRGLLLASGFHINTINEYLKEDEIDEAKDTLIELLYSQVMDLTLMSKIELGDDVIEEIKRLKGIINEHN